MKKSLHPSSAPRKLARGGSIFTHIHERRAALPNVFKVAELRAATDDFSEDRLVGTGGFARVYRGTLETGEDVAVKRWDDGSDAAALMNELETLTRIAHY